MICQHGINKKGEIVDRVDYDALKRCLDDITKNYSSNEYIIHMPKIGCGLACGNYDRILELIENNLPGFEKIMYII